MGLSAELGPYLLNAGLCNGAIDAEEDESFQEDNGSSRRSDGACFLVTILLSVSMHSPK